MFKKDGKIKASDDLLFFFSYFCSKFSFWIIYTKKLNENETRKYLSHELPFSKRYKQTRIASLNY